MMELGFVHRQRRLGHVGDVLGVLDLELVHVLLVLHQHDLLRGLPHRAFDLLVAVVADEHDRVAVVGEAHRLAVDLRDQRAGGVDRLQVALDRALANARGDAVGREHAHRPLGDFGVLVDEDRAPLAQVLTTCLLWTISLRTYTGRAVDLQRTFDRLDGSIDACAVATGRCQQQLLDRVRHGRSL